MITLEAQIKITTVKIESITIRLLRDGAEVTAEVAILDETGVIRKRELVHHPNPNSFVKQIVANPKAAFDYVDNLMVSKYPGVVVSNDDVTW